MISACGALAIAPRAGGLAHEAARPPLAPAPRLRVEDTLGALLDNPAFAGFAPLLLPWDGRSCDRGMPLADMATLMPYHTRVDPVVAVVALNRMVDDANVGRRMFLDIYTEAEKRADPAKARTGLFLFRGRPGAPFAIVCPGGGFAYVGSLHEGFPYAVAINAAGYNAFVLRYRSGLGERAATEDLAAALSTVFRQAAALGVATAGYSLWGQLGGSQDGGQPRVAWRRSLGRRHRAETRCRGHGLHRPFRSRRHRAAHLRHRGRAGRHRAPARDGAADRRPAHGRNADRVPGLRGAGPRLRSRHRHGGRRLDRRCRAVLGRQHIILGAGWGCPVTEDLPLTVLVVGATGSVGRHVVVEALAKGHRVRALVRHPSEAGLPPGITVVAGDLTRPASLQLAVDRVDAVVFTHGSTGGDAGARDIFYAGVREVLAALAGRPVRIALMTTIGVTDRGRAHDWKRRAERLVRASGLPYVIVRPGWFDMAASDQRRLVLLQGDRRRTGTPQDGAVARQQIAAVLVAGLDAGGPPGRTFELIAELGVERPPAALLAEVDPDPPGSLDGGHDEANMPMAAEPKQVTADLDRIRDR